MDKLSSIFDLLNQGIPQAVTRFNDGEVRGILRPGDTVARGCQKVDDLLSFKLTRALEHKQENYWKGLPCSLCYPKYHRKVFNYISKKDPYLTHATVFVNRNYESFIKNIPELLKGRNIYWVGSAHHNTKKLSELGIKIHNHIKLSRKNAWAFYDQVNSMAFDFPIGSIVLLACGPMAEVLIYDWYRLNPRVTYLDMGGVFDPWVQDKKYRYHTHKLPSCKECN